MSRKKKKKGILASRFYRVYFATVALALIAVAVGLLWLNGVVRDYEISQPAHAAGEVARLFEEGDYARLFTLDTAAGEISGGDRDFYVESLLRLAEGKAVSWRELYSGDSNEKKYGVALDGDRIATFTLVPSGDTTAHGNTLWRLGSVTTNVALAESPAVEEPQPQSVVEQPAVAAASCRVRAPAGYAVSVNGQPLSEQDSIRAGEPVYAEGFLPSGVEGPTMTTYAFECDGEPQIVATDASGAEIQALPDGENAWVCPLGEDAQAREQYADAIVKLATKIAKYTVKDASQSAVLGVVASDSPAEDILKKFSNSWAPPHKTAKVTDATVSDFHLLSDDCFTCHVEFTFTLTTRRGNDYVYPTAYTFCIIRKRGEGKLYNLMFN